MQENTPVNLPYEQEEETVAEQFGMVKEFLEDEEFYRAQFLKKRYDISDPTLFRWIKSGKFPAPEYLNGQRVWRKSVILKAETNLLSAA